MDRRVRVAAALALAMLAIAGVFLPWYGTRTDVPSPNLVSMVVFGAEGTLRGLDTRGIHAVPLLVLGIAALLGSRRAGLQGPAASLAALLFAAVFFLVLADAADLRLGPLNAAPGPAFFGVAALTLLAALLARGPARDDLDPDRADATGGRLAGSAATALALLAAVATLLPWTESEAFADGTRTGLQTGGLLPYLLFALGAAAGASARRRRGRVDRVRVALPVAAALVAAGTAAALLFGFALRVAPPAAAPLRAHLAPSLAYGWWIAAGAGVLATALALAAVLAVKDRAPSR